MIKREKSEVGRDNSEDDDDADDDDDDNDYDDDDDVKEKTVKHQHRKNSCRQHQQPNASVSLHNLQIIFDCFNMKRLKTQCLQSSYFYQHQQ